MRHHFHAQTHVPIITIEKIQLPHKRHIEAPPLFASRQWIWNQRTFNVKIFALFKAKIRPSHENADKTATVGF